MNNRFAQSDRDQIMMFSDDGKIMKRNEKISQSYNIQASSSEGYIVAIDIAEGNAENDLKQLVPILSQVERNVGKRIEKASADSGYEAHYFNYNEDEDHFICPEGKSLEFHREYVEDGRKYTSYHAKPADCVICTVRKECCTAKVKIAAIAFNFSKMIRKQLV